VSRKNEVGRSQLPTTTDTFILNMDLKEGKLAVHLARKSAEAFLSGRKSPEERLPEVFYENRGAFVTLHTYPGKELRGCIGYPEPVFPLKKALEECTVYACQDSRFPRVQKSELDKIIFEISILTKPQVMESDKKDYPKNVKIGEDGLIVRKGYHSGLLLPQVAPEHGLLAVEFLEHTCMKAGLPKGSWMEKDCEVFKFQAEIFGEKTPDGVVEKVKA
jgi:uncharacterized protein (TIGR00296 family)